MAEHEVDQHLRDLVRRLLVSTEPFPDALEATSGPDGTAGEDLAELWRELARIVNFGTPENSTAQHVSEVAEDEYFLPHDSSLEHPSPSIH